MRGTLVSALNLIRPLIFHRPGGDRIAVLRIFSSAPTVLPSQPLTPDNRFPDLREHAIFALRNLLEGNPENQRVVDEIRPLPRPPS